MGKAANANDVFLTNRVCRRNADLYAIPEFSYAPDITLRWTSRGRLFRQAWHCFADKIIRIFLLPDHTSENLPEYTRKAFTAVSYTHLTLPTIPLV